MRIIIDAMGGDHAPDAIVAGTVRAAKELDAELVLVGRGAEVLQALEQQGITNLPKGLEVSRLDLQRLFVLLTSDPEQTIAGFPRKGGNDL